MGEELPREFGERLGNGTQNQEVVLLSNVQYCILPEPTWDDYQLAYLRWSVPENR